MDDTNKGAIYSMEIDGAYRDYIAMLVEDDFDNTLEYFAKFDSDADLVGNDDAESYLWDMYAAIDILNSIGTYMMNLDKLKKIYNNILNSHFHGQPWWEE